MATLKECIDSLNELQDIWEHGNQESLHFCRYMRRALEELSWEFITQDEDIPADVEQYYNMLEDAVFNCWRHAKIMAGECSMTLIPKGE